MEQWDKSFYISSVAGSNNGSSIVVMSKGINVFLVTCIITLLYPHLLVTRTVLSLLLHCCIYIHYSAIFPTDAVYP
jgi:hypothetical protein